MRAGGRQEHKSIRPPDSKQNAPTLASVTLVKVGGRGVSADRTEATAAEGTPSDREEQLLCEDSILSQRELALRKRAKAADSAIQGERNCLKTSQ